MMSMYSRGNILANRFKDCSTDVKQCLFKTYCSNAYGGQLWGAYRSSAMTKINVAYNDVCRKLFRIRRGVSISAIFVSNSINSFRALRRKLVYSFMTRIYASDNILVQTIIKSAAFKHSVANCEWTKILYI